MPLNLQRSAAAAGRVGMFDARSQLLDDFEQLLLGPRASKNVPPYLQGVMARALPRSRPEGVDPDVMLTDLFRFDEADLPIYNNNFCAELGRMAERMVESTVRAGGRFRVEASDEVMTALQARYERAIIRKPVGRGSRKRRLLKWKRPDFIIDDKWIVEVKYRFTSYQNQQDQIDAAYVYASLGYQSIFIHISPDCRRATELAASGWDLHVGDEALAWIQQVSGFDFRDLLRSTANLPSVSQALTVEREALCRRWSEALILTMEHSPSPVQESMISHIATNDTHFGEVIRRRAPLSPDDLDLIRRETFEITDEKIGEIRDTDIDRIQDHLDDLFGIVGDEDRQERKRDFLASLADNTLRDMLNVSS